MTEDESKDWLRNKFDVSRETLDQLDGFVAMVRAEMVHQNLISKSSAEHMWPRHIVDSAQLLLLIGDDEPRSSENIWLDLGTGAGFPGIVIAILSGYKVKMVESRTKRVAFLNRVVDALGIQSNAAVLGSQLEKIKAFPANVISARAFAPLPRLIPISHQFSTEKTVWLLPKGKNAVRELEQLPEKWQKMFHVEQSFTDAEAKILVGRGKIGL